MSQHDTPEVKGLKIYDEQTDFLNDPKGIIHNDFKVPTSMYNRTKFWFDIYTKYTSKDKVIHHVDFPWVIFDVVETGLFYQKDYSSLNQWQRNNLAAKAENKAILDVKKALKKIFSKKKVKLTEYENNIKSILIQHNLNKKKWKRKLLRSVRSQSGQKDIFLTAYNTSGLYLTEMENIFLNYGLPLELTRLPFVESSFNIKAQSKVGASGIWQVMPRIGRHYGHINKKIDERNSPFKASHMSAKILKQNFNQFQDWSLAVTAYNHGNGNLKKAIRRTQSKDLGKIIANYNSKRFMFASKNFYSCFLAALYAEKYAKSIFLAQGYRIHRTPPLSTFKAKTNKPTFYKNLLEKHNISDQSFKALNPDFKPLVTTNKTKIPKDIIYFIPKIKTLSLAIEEQESMIK
jgi:membrane-bound lytic murein transglycosylase D